LAQQRQDNRDDPDYDDEMAARSADPTLSRFGGSAYKLPRVVPIESTPYGDVPLPDGQDGGGRPGILDVVNIPGELVLKIYEAMTETGEIPVNLMRGQNLSQAEIESIFDMYSEYEDLQILGAGQETERTNAAAELLSKQTEKAMAENKFEESKRVQKLLDAWNVTKRGWDSDAIRESQRRFEIGLVTAKNELEFNQNQAKMQLQGLRDQLTQQGSQFDATLNQQALQLEQQISEFDRSLDLERKGLTIEEGRLELSGELGRGELQLGQRRLSQQASQFEAQRLQTNRLAAIQNPYGFAAANMLGLGGAGGQGQQLGAGGQGQQLGAGGGIAPVQQGLSDLGFGIPSGAQAGQFTPARKFFSGGIPTLGKLSQASPESVAAAQPFLSFTGTSPREFQRQSAAITPKPR
jgi:hypothetical protein